MRQYSDHDLGLLAGWHRCCGEVTGETERLWALRDDFLDMIDSGDPRWTKDFVLSLWRDDGWSWPWFDRWRDAFAADRVVPYMWRDPRDYPSIRLSLFAHVAVMRAYEARNWRQSCKVLECLRWQPGMPFPAGHPTWAGWRLVTMADDVPEISQLAFETFLAGNHDYRPPYFPGDRSRICYERKPRPMVAR
jgi:hypothetical protein